MTNTQGPMSNYKVSFLLVIIFAAAIFVLLNKGAETPDGIYIRIAGQDVRVIAAFDSASREQGLSGRESLEEDQGMLFKFDVLGKYNFWMKDMNFPIDMIFMDENFKVVYIKKNATPESYPDAFGGEVESMYVLEVVSGFSDKYGLKVGDQAEVIEQ